MKAVDFELRFDSVTVRRLPIGAKLREGTRPLTATGPASRLSPAASVSNKKRLSGRSRRVLTELNTFSLTNRSVRIVRL